MINVLVRHKVENFDAWKVVFDHHAETRRQGGSQGVIVLRNLEDPTEVCVLMQWEDLASAREFASSPELKERMKQGGVLEAPDIVFLAEAGRSRV